MAPNTGKRARRDSASADDDAPTTEALEQPTGDDAAAEGETDAEAPPMNRAERRLEAKRKKGRQTMSRVPQQGTTAPTNAMRRQGVKGLANNMKGTNTRRSG